MSSIIESLKWRYATKKFDATKKISKENLETLLEGVQLSASSYGLQPYQIFVIEDSEIREKLKSAAWNQTQLTDASQVVVFANHKSLDEAYVDNYIKNIAETRDMKVEDLQGMADMIKNSTLQMPAEMQNEWAQKQCYLALGFLLNTAAELKIDVCPMEGFSAEEFDTILGLQEKGLHTAVIACVGYRSEEDKYQHAAKVRKSTEDLFNFI
ncbi:NAD(P)H-dependent oxidoreductase [Zunongwangia sp. SCSIO 43204]|uniref:NAD(P)H-dependent oxidoreductase n=1 Tax=Zunongwangia sp. SCSIO 43204 TaxID=2779359 RepID=UPI001CA81A04|nr:NAD(P)H-dependent oxidoreductase [Zunongwangia sp. SCSIO 43204]UAB84492.1 NAD(P)H-dependent oxidoreductase [Zunongwangia sp. SCSIO 43204]